MLSPLFSTAGRIDVAAASTSPVYVTLTVRQPRLQAAARSHLTPPGRTSPAASAFPLRI
jgi:hypothetical protein